MGVGNSKQVISSTEYRLKETSSHDGSDNTQDMCNSTMCKDFNDSTTNGYITYEPNVNKFTIQKKKSKHTRQIFIKHAIHTSLKPLTQK